MREVAKRAPEEAFLQTWGVRSGVCVVNDYHSMGGGGYTYACFGHWSGPRCGDAERI